MTKTNIVRRLRECSKAYEEAKINMIYDTPDIFVEAAEEILRLRDLLHEIEAMAGRWSHVYVSSDEES